MGTRAYLLAAVAAAVVIAGAGCGSSDDSDTKTSTQATAPSTTTSGSIATTTVPELAPATPPSGSDLQALIGTPQNSQRTDGPDSIHDSGIHMHFLVNGAPVEVMDAYKAALESKGWTLTVENSGGHGGGGGATYTGTNGTSYGVFTGGGYGNTTDVNSCAWPSKPANTNCGEHH